MKNYFFIDSKSKFSADQYAFAFENGLFSPDEIEVIVRFRLKSFLGNIRAWWKYRFRLRFVRRVREALLSKEGGSIFYFFNSIENVTLVKNRAYTHIFLGHGESNKRASLHPLYRIYDYLLVAGPYASQRLIQYGILNQATAMERVLDIGSAGVANVEIQDLLMIGEGDFRADLKALLYMPTWEGGMEDENYSTLDEPCLYEFLLETARKFSVGVIYIKPHPNTGRRIKAQKTFLADLMDKLKHQGVKLLIAEKDFPILPYSRRSRLGARRCPPMKSLPNFACAIVDISAAESMAAKIGVPSLVLSPRTKPFYAPESYIALKGSSIVRLQDWGSMEECASYVYSQAYSDYQPGYINIFREDGNKKFMNALAQIQGQCE